MTDEQRKKIEEAVTSFETMIFSGFLQGKDGGNFTEWYKRNDMEKSIRFALSNLIQEESRDEYAIGAMQFVLNKVFDKTNMPSQRPTKEDLVKVLELYKIVLTSKDKQLRV